MIVFDALRRSRCVSEETVTRRVKRPGRGASEDGVPTRSVGTRERLSARYPHLLSYPLRPLRRIAVLVLEQLVLDRINQGQPTRLDDVLADADGAPDAGVVARLDHDAHPGRRGR